MGNNVYHRWFDGHKHKLEVIKEFPIDLYVKSREGKHKSIYGDPLKRFEFSCISDAKEMVKEFADIQNMQVYGQTAFEHQFIAAEYKGQVDFKFENFVIANIDIETEFDDSGFPRPEAAQFPVTAIAVDIIGDKTYLFAYVPFKPIDDTEYFYCRDERDMFYQFIDLLHKKGVHIWTGWNINGFDIPYLINRITNEYGEEVANRLSPFHAHSSKCISRREHAQGIDYSILGVTLYDYMELYKKYQMDKKERYSLDFISNDELGESKLDYSEYDDLMDLYRRNPQKYLEYNIRDTKLVARLEKKLAYLNLALTIAFMTKNNPGDVFSPVKTWSVYCYHTLNDSGIVIPPLRHPEQVNFAGGYVKDPQIGRHRWLVSFDLTSLYPSIIRTWNMSPEKKVDGGIFDNIVNRLIDLDYDTEFLIERDLCMAANGATFKRDSIGFMPKIVGMMFNERKAEKNRMLAKQGELEQIKAEMDRRGLKH
jgi:DNA polymerase elongation subunit (family B)